VKVATQNAIELIRRAVPKIAELGDRPCPCQSALALAIWSDRSRISAEVKEKLKPILGKYLE
jgi:5'-methylthioadenosine phosphorylase